VKGNPKILLPRDPDGRRAAVLALLPLAVERSEPMLAISGLPSAIVKSPGVLRDLARRTISADRATRGNDGNGPGGRSIDGTDAIADFVDSVAQAYGTGTAEDLLEWLICFHVDRAQRNRLSSWASVFQLAAAGRSLESTGPPLDQAVRRVLIDAAETAFGSTANTHLKERIRAAYQIPLSPLEERLLAMEVSQEGDVEQWDAVQDMELNATLTGARNVRAAIKDRLTSTQFLSLIEWARQLLKTRGDLFGSNTLASDTECGAG
jgi:hypothetical protein